MMWGFYHSLGNVRGRNMPCPCLSRGTLDGPCVTHFLPMAGPMKENMFENKTATKTVSIQIESLIFIQPWYLKPIGLKPLILADLQSAATKPRGHDCSRGGLCKATGHVSRRGALIGSTSGCPVPNFTLEIMGLSDHQFIIHTI